MRLSSLRADSRVEALPEVRPAALRRPSLSVRILDLLIAAYAIALLLFLVTGGVDLGLITINEGAKPLLVLAIAIPLRLALNQSSWLLESVAGAARTVLRPWRKVRSTPLACALVDVAFAVIVTRTATFTIGFIVNLLFSPSRARPTTMPFEAMKFAEIFVAWDSGWYFDIAKRGYYYSADGQSSIAFFPLYPMLMRALASPFGATDRTLWVAGIVVSCVAFVLALVALHRFAERVLGSREAAFRTVLCVAVFPHSLFMTRVYSESLFLLTSVLAVSHAYDQRWKTAGLWGALATLTRPNGILIAVPLAVLAIADRPGVRPAAVRGLWLLPLPAVLAGFCVFVYTLSGDPLAWLSAQSQWGYFLWNPPWEQLLKLLGRLEKYGLYDYFFVSPRAPFHFFNGLIALLFLALTPAVFKRLGAGMGMYVLVSLLIPLSSNSLEGIGRYAAVLFPVFILLGSVESRRIHEGIVITGALLLALFVALFVTLHPIY